MSYIAKSPWLIHYDASSCNGCDIEVLACLTPVYDVERFGIINTGNPKHADIFLVTGSVNEQNKNVVMQIYEQMPEPKVVVAVGICACSGGVFKDCYNVMGGVDTVIPVDVYVPGCAARPESIIDGVVKGLSVLTEKRKQLVEKIAMGRDTIDSEKTDDGTLPEDESVSAVEACNDEESLSAGAEEADVVSDGALKPDSLDQPAPGDVDSDPTEERNVKSKEDPPEGQAEGGEE